MQIPGWLPSATLGTAPSTLAGLREARAFRGDCGQPNGDPVLVTAPGVEVDSGDSGGGLLLEDAPPSAPLGVGPCSQAAAAAPGELALVGVTTMFSETGGEISSLFTPVFTSENADFIASVVSQSGDRDGDGLWDPTDGCPDSPSDGTNSNRAAEEAWGRVRPERPGMLQFLDDVCDPAPTPVARLRSRFPAVRPGQRVVRDQLFVEPVLGAGFAPETFQTTFRFCSCREADGTPVDDPSLCHQAPYHCRLFPTLADNVEVGMRVGPLPDGTTTWHRITTLPAGLPFCPFVLEPERCVGAELPVTAPSSERHLGTWDYRADEARWTALGYFPAARGYPSSEVAPGENLAGVFWSHGDTAAGAFEHGLLNVAGEQCLRGYGADSACTLADHFTFRVLSDPATPVERLGPRSSPLDLDLAAPPGSPARFPGESDGGPRPLLTLERDTLRAVAWFERGERAVVTDTLSASLRAALAAAEITWIPPSEPLSAAQTPRAPLAVGLRRADGALAELIVAGAGGGLALPSDDTAHGDALFTAPPERRAASEAGARAGYGAVYSRLFELVAVFGGVRGGAPADELTVTTAGEVRSVPLWGKAAPRRVVAATFAGRDRRLWAIDERPRLHGPPRRYLVRIDPTTGRVETRRRVPALEPFERVWLRATPEGDALLVVSSHLGHATFVLRARRFELAARVEVRGLQLGLGRLETLPLVARRQVSAGVRVVTHDDDRLESRVIADLDHLQGGACDLAHDLR